MVEEQAAEVAEVIDDTRGARRAVNHLRLSLSVNQVADLMTATKLVLATAEALPPVQATTTKEEARVAAFVEALTTLTAARDALSMDPCLYGKHVHTKALFVGAQSGG